MTVPVTQGHILRPLFFHRQLHHLPELLQLTFFAYLVTQTVLHSFARKATEYPSLR